MKKILLYLLAGVALLVATLLIAAASLYFSTAGDYSAEKTVMDDPSLPFVEVNGVKLHAKAFGDPANPPVFILHGGPGNDFRMLLSLRELEDKFYLVYYDQRGAGLSQRVEAEKITLQSYFDDLGAIIDHFAPNRQVSLIGHSWGAMLASGYTARNPEKIDKLVLAEPGFLTPESMAVFMTYMTPESPLAFFSGAIMSGFRSLHLEAPDDHAQLDFLMQDLFLNGDPSGNPTKGYYCNDDPSTGSMPMWRFGFVAMVASQSLASADPASMDFVTGIDKWPGEALFLSGECNRLIGPDYQEKWHIPLFPKSRHVIISGAGHTMFGERYIDANAVTRAYLDGELPGK